MRQTAKTACTSLSGAIDSKIHGTRNVGTRESFQVEYPAMYLSRFGENPKWEISQRAVSGEPFARAQRHAKSFRVWTSKGCFCLRASAERRRVSGTLPFHKHAWQNANSNFLPFMTFM